MLSRKIMTEIEMTVKIELIYDANFLNVKNAGRR